MTSDVTRRRPRRRHEMAPLRSETYWTNRVQAAGGDPKLLADIERERLWSAVASLSDESAKAQWWAELRELLRNLRYRV